MTLSLLDLLKQLHGLGATHNELLTLNNLKLTNYIISYFQKHLGLIEIPSANSFSKQHLFSFTALVASFLYLM